MDRIRANIHERVTDAFEDPDQVDLYVNVLPASWEDEDYTQFFLERNATTASTECSYNVTRLVGRCGSDVRDRILRRITAEVVSCIYSLVRGIGVLYPKEPDERCLNMYYVTLRLRPRLHEIQWDASTTRLEYRVVCRLTMYRIQEIIYPYACSPHITPHPSLPSCGCTSSARAM